MCNAPSGRTRTPEPSVLPTRVRGAPDVLFLGCSGPTMLPDSRQPSPPSPGESIPRFQTSGGRWTSHAGKWTGGRLYTPPSAPLRGGGTCLPCQAASPQGAVPGVRPDRCPDRVCCRRRPPSRGRPREPRASEAALVAGSCAGGRGSLWPLPLGGGGGKSGAGTEGPGAAGTRGRGSSARLRSPGAAPPPPRLGILGVAVQTPEGLRCPPTFSAAAPDVSLSSFNFVALLELLKRRFRPLFPWEKRPRDCAFPCRVTRSGGRAAPGGRSWWGPS